MNQTILHMYPDYADALFWNEEGTCIGGVNSIHIDNHEIDLTPIYGLKKWYDDWDLESLYHNKRWNDERWRQWQYEGLMLACRIKKILPSSIELFFMWDSEHIWEIHPEDTDDGGVFAYGTPMRVPNDIYIMQTPDTWFGCAISDVAGVGCGDNNFIYEVNNKPNIDLRSLPNYQNWYIKGTNYLLAAQEVRNILPDDVVLFYKSDILELIK